MFKEIQKQIDETNAFTERLKALNARIEILLENERQNQLKQAAEMTRLEREINDIIFDQTQKVKAPGCMRRQFGVGTITGVVCPCPLCSPFSTQQPAIYFNSGDMIDHIERLRNMTIASSGSTFVVPTLNKQD